MTPRWLSHRLADSEKGPEQCCPGPVFRPQHIQGFKTDETFGFDRQKSTFTEHKMAAGKGRIHCNRSE